MVGLLSDGPARAPLLEAARSFDHGLERGIEGRTGLPEAVNRPRIALEGLGMGTALLDILRPREAPRAERILIDRDARFVALGVGMAHARLAQERVPAWLGPWRDQAWNGWGFQRAAMEPHRLRGAVRLGGPRQPDVWIGAGRALWFLYAGDAAGLVRRLALADAEPLPYLWQGVGIASAFAGGCTEHAHVVLHDACPDTSLERGRALGFEAASSP